ncbi:MAG TPA: RNA polymerase sigma factor [Polyangiaceae bacterium]|nr:RNA polymerase sigma factor [Polyangiaceae bacterium]
MTIEHELIASALEGDGRAFASLVAPHLPMLYRIAARACGSRALAEDAVQETLTIAYTSLARFRPNSSLKAFLAAIATSRAQTLLRSERRRRKSEEQALPGERASEPSELLDAERLSARIRHALAAMPQKRQKVVLLRLDAALSYAEIALALGTTEGSARVLLHLGLRELKELIDREQSEQGAER